MKVPLLVSSTLEYSFQFIGYIPVNTMDASIPRIVPFPVLAAQFMHPVLIEPSSIENSAYVQSLIYFSSHTSHLHRT